MYHSLTLVCFRSGETELFFSGKALIGALILGKGKILPPFLGAGVSVGMRQQFGDFFLQPEVGTLFAPGSTPNPLSINSLPGRPVFHAVMPSKEGISHSNQVVVSN